MELAELYWELSARVRARFSLSVAGLIEAAWGRTFWMAIGPSAEAGHING
jgi:hypothetical protein